MHFAKRDCNVWKFSICTSINLFIFNYNSFHKPPKRQRVFETVRYHLGGWSEQFLFALVSFIATDTSRSSCRKEAIASFNYWIIDEWSSSFFPFSAQHDPAGPPGANDDKIAVHDFRVLSWHQRGRPAGKYDEPVSRQIEWHGRLEPNRNVQ